MNRSATSVPMWISRTIRFRLTRVVSWAVRVVLLACLTLSAVPDCRIAAAVAWGGSESSDSIPRETEESGDPLESSTIGDEFVPPRQRGDRVASRSHMRFFLPPVVKIELTVAAPTFTSKALSGGRHAQRNGIGAPLLC